MAKSKRDQTLPERIRAATRYQLLPGAANTSSNGTLRTNRWPIIIKYNDKPDGIALATREAGVYLRRQLAKLERDGQLILLGPDAPVHSSPNNVTSSRTDPVPEDEESRYPEGAASYRRHRELERDTNLAKRAKQQLLQETGHLSCDVCDFDFERRYKQLGSGYIEAHHTIPVSQLKGVTNTRITDLALVCSNCHRMLHRGSKLLTIEELKALLVDDD